MHQTSDHGTLPPGYEQLHQVPPGTPVMVVIGNRCAVVGTYAAADVNPGTGTFPDLLNLSLAMPRCTDPDPTAPSDPHCPLHYPTSPSEIFAAIVQAVATARQWRAPQHRTWGDVSSHKVNIALAVTRALLQPGTEDDR